MGSFADWIVHRADVLGLSWPDGVADASGVAQATLDAIVSTEDVRDIARSARGYLARALKISLRELEALSARDIPWIGDDRIVDFERLSPGATIVVNRAALSVVPCAISHGVSILGKIDENGVVESWPAEDGPRLGVRYPAVPDAFSLQLQTDVQSHRAGTCLVFQVIVPADFDEGELALLTRDAVEAETEFGMVHLRSDSSIQFYRMGKTSFIERGEILRAARVIGAHCRTSAE